MIGILDAFWELITNFFAVLERIFYAIVLAVDSLFTFIGGVSTYVSEAVIYIPELAILSVAGAVGVAMIIVNILRDLL